MRHHLLSQDEARDLLETYAIPLREIIERAWQRWLENPDAATASRRTRASAIYDYVTEAVEQRFDGDPRVTFAWKHGALTMTVASTAVIRFKKFRGRTLLTSGISTFARQRFLGQEGTLDGMVVTHLVVGYLLDELESQPERIAVTCPHLRGNLWSFELPTGGTLFDAELAPMRPFEPDAGGTIIRSARVAEPDVKAVEEE